jgi:hypothetical protein
VQDIVFIAVVVAFFAVAVLLVTGCERILSNNSDRPES